MKIDIAAECNYGQKKKSGRVSSFMSGVYSITDEQVKDVIYERLEARSVENFVSIRWV